MTSPAASALALLEAAPLAPVEVASDDPVGVHLGNLGSEKSRRSVKRALLLAASELTTLAPGLGWTGLRYVHVAGLRARLSARGLAPATVNHCLSAVRGVLREAVRLELMAPEDGVRACGVPNVRGSRVPTGRALAVTELGALLAAAREQPHAGPRDVALLAIAYGAGLRRAELAALDVAALDVASGALRILGKGDKERIAYLPAWALVAARSWLDVRGAAPGPLLCRVDKAGKLDLSDSLSDEAIRYVLARLARLAGVTAFSPHDLRRTYIGDLLEAGADLSTVQQLVGHAQPTTTARYDRRGETSKRRASALLRDPSAT